MRYQILAAAVVLVVLALVLRACDGRHACSDNPAFYLKGTAADCATQRR